MILEPKIIRRAVHPFVDSAYIAEQGDHHKVLVINAVKAGEKKRRDLYADFLSELDIISDSMQREGDEFDRVDIHFG